MEEAFFGPTLSPLQQGGAAGGGFFLYRFCGRHIKIADHIGDQLPDVI